jgi:glyoxylase-like metal-dependent hydrolase (beta-lactamase superfamily II)
MNISVFSFNLFAENTYILFDDTNEAIIIDPGCYSGDEKQILLQFIDKNNLKPIAILNTHCHIDHILGVDFLKNYFKIQFWANKNDQYLLDDIFEAAKFYNFKLDQIPKIDRNITEKDKIHFGNQTLDVLQVPGHTKGHLAFFSKQDQFVLTGDVLFKDTIGRTDLPGGNLEQLMNSLYSKILPLGDQVIVYPGHGPATQIGFERKDNPFL